jgi:hypothetical protein
MLNEIVSVDVEIMPNVIVLLFVLLAVYLVLVRGVGGNRGVGRDDWLGTVSNRHFSSLLAPF